MDIHLETDSESLQNFLASLTQLTAPPLVLAPRPVQPAASLPTPINPPFPVLRRGEVIEIQGPASSGKTHLLYHVLLSLLLPVPPPTGPQIAAVVYDTDGSFDIHRFRHLLLSRILKLPAATLDPLGCVRHSLARLHLFRPTSLAQLAASIASLSAYHSSHMPNQEIAILAIDSVSTFYWTDRFSAEQLRSIGTEKVSNSIVPPLHSVLNTIQRVQLSHCPLVVLTNWALSSSPSPPEALYKQHLHPFPTIEKGIADPGANVSISTDRASSSPLHLAHHITLSFPSLDPLPAPPLDHVLFHQIHGLIRSSETRDAIPFSLRVTEEDIVVEPRESIEVGVGHVIPLQSHS